MWRRQLDVKPI